MERAGIASPVRAARLLNRRLMEKFVRDTYSSAPGNRREALMRPADILLVEDNPGDVRLTMEVLKGGRFANRLIVANDGVEAMAVLRRTGPHKGQARPDLVLLDLNLPRKDGRSVLSEMKADEELKRIPVVILTTSSSDADVLRSYNLQANCYITKPVDLAQFTRVIKQIHDFWLATARLPPQ